MALVSPSCVQSLNSRCRLSDRRVVDAPALSRCCLSRSASIRVLRQKCIAARPKHTANATPMPNPNHGAMVRSIVGGGGDGGGSGGGGGGDGRGGDGGGGNGGSGGDAGERGLFSTCFECCSSLKPEQRRNGSVQCFAPHAKQSGWSGTLAHSSLRSHSTRYVRHTFAFGAQGASCPAPLLRTAHTWLVTRLAGTYSTEAPGRTCQLRFDQAVVRAAVSVLRRAVGTMPR